MVIELSFHMQLLKAGNSPNISQLWNGQMICGTLRNGTTLSNKKEQTPDTW